MSVVAPEPAGLPENSIVAPEAPAPAPAPAPETPAVPDGYYPKEYVDQLREEAKTYRERFEPYYQTFKDFDDEDRQAWLQLAQMARNEDPDTRTQLAQALGLALPPEETPQYVTQAEVDARLEAVLQQREMDNAIEDFYKAGESYGLQRNTPEMATFMAHLNYSMDMPDTAKAWELMQAERQKIIEDYIKEKGAQANVPVTTDQQGQPAKPREEPKTPAEARRAAQARFEAAARGM